MAIRPPPSKPSHVLIAIQRKAKQEKTTAYALSEKTGIAINTIRRVLHGEGSPTLATTEAIAAALGLALKIEEE